MTVQLQDLSYEVIEKASEKYENVREVVIQLDIDEKIQFFKVEIYKHFGTIQVVQCVQELVDKLDRVRIKNGNDAMDKVFTPYMIFLIVKHFTTLKLPETLPEQLKAIEHMTNSGALFQILLSFDEDEVDKIHDEISKVVNNFDNNLAEVEDFKEQVRKKLKDKSLMD